MSSGFGCDGLLGGDDRNAAYATLALHGHLSHVTH